MGSCLLSFINEKIAEGKKEFQFFSVNWAGQNQNTIIAGLYLYVAAKYKVDILHYVFEVGHTQNKNDFVHANIEKVTRHIDVYTPSQWIALLKSCRPRQPHKVKELLLSYIVSIKHISQSIACNYRETPKK